MAAKKKEAVTISFHFLTREIKDGSSTNRVPFSLTEFDKLFKEIKKKPSIDMSDEVAVDRLRFRLDAPLEKVIRVDERTIFGLFKASYWGHSYDNTAKGQIPSDSISLRPFHFLLYLSESGRIYISCQYLGQFGGYAQFQKTILDLLDKSNSIFSHSFRLGSSYYKNADAKEVRVSFSDHSSSISGRNLFVKSGVIAFKKSSKEDGFEAQVAKRLFPFLGKPHGHIRKIVAELINEGKLLDIKDEDIEDCTVIASVNGNLKTIHMMENGNFASKFPIDVPLNADGHPEYKPTKRAMLSVLKEEIIARKENE